MQRYRTLLFLPILLLLGLTTATIAQSGGDLDLSWATIDGGGGMSDGGDFALRGTVGQPDAGRLSGSGFSVQGGFWQCQTAVISTPTITALTPNIQLSWPGGSMANVYRASNDPYFTPTTPYATGVGTNWTDSGAAGGSSTNYTYIIRATGSCGEAGNSQRLGEFDFDIVPGN